MFANHSQQTAHSLPLVAFDQPQQYNQKVLPLALTEVETKVFSKLTQLLRKAYNWLGHDISLGFRFPQTCYPDLDMPFYSNSIKCKECDPIIQVLHISNG